MAKTKEELNTLKQEYESLATKLSDLTEEELEEIVGGEVGGIREWFEKIGDITRKTGV